MSTRRRVAVGTEATSSRAAVGLAYVQRAAAAAPIPRRAPFAVGAFGPTEAEDAVPSTLGVLEAIRRRSRGVPVTITFVGGSGTDFDAPLGGLANPASGAPLADDDLFIFFGSQSVYDRSFPPGALSLAWSSQAVQWLSAIPAPVPDHIGPFALDGELARAYRRRAAEDWARFLDHRARELRASGRLVVVGAAADPSGDSGWGGLFELANESLRDMVRDGVLRAGEYEAMTIPVWYRTPEEFLQPFFGQEVNEDLELEDHAPILLPDVLRERLTEDGDVEGYAIARARDFVRANGRALFASLAGDRTAPEREQLTRELEERLGRRIEHTPDAAACCPCVYQLLIAKAS